METVEILHYKWCVCDVVKHYEDYVWISANTEIDGISCKVKLIYCKVEKWVVYEDIQGMCGYGVYGPIKEQGIRTVPVKREEMERI